MMLLLMVQKSGEKTTVWMVHPNPSSIIGWFLPFPQVVNFSPGFWLPSTVVPWFCESFNPSSPASPGDCGDCSPFRIATLESDVSKKPQFGTWWRWVTLRMAPGGTRTKTPKLIGWFTGFQVRFISVLVSFGCHFQVKACSISVG